MQYEIFDLIRGITGTEFKAHLIKVRYSHVSQPYGTQGERIYGCDLRKEDLKCSSV